MGCLRLTYRENPTPLKVVHSNFKTSEKGCAGIYRYGFNGQERDQETGWQNYKYRMYNSKIARFFSVDPIADEYPMLTPYQHSSLNPVSLIELEGLEGARPRSAGEETGEVELAKDLFIGLVNLLDQVQPGDPDKKFDKDHDANQPYGEPLTSENPGPDSDLNGEATEEEGEENNIDLLMALAGSAGNVPRKEFVTKNLSDKVQIPMKLVETGDKIKKEVEEIKKNNSGEEEQEKGDSTVNIIDIYHNKGWYNDPDTVESTKTLPIEDAETEPKVIHHGPNSSNN